MIVESDNRCEFCGKKMLTQIYKESYGEYNMFDFCPDCDGRPGGIAYEDTTKPFGYLPQERIYKELQEEYYKNDD
nr:MAG TPA: zinc finger domain-containing protein [Caudoviricetes sp.]